MPRPITQVVSPVADDPNGISTTQTPAAGGVQNLTITGDLASGGVATFSQPQHVTISSAGIDTTRVFTITGTDRNGVAISETITGVNTATVAGLLNFATVTQISVDDDTAAAITAGVDGTCEGGWIPVDSRDDIFNIGFSVAISAGGAMTYGIEHTYDDIEAGDFVENDAVLFDHPSVTAETTNQDGAYTNPISAIRLNITAHTGGSATLRLLQAGMGS